MDSNMMKYTPGQTLLVELFSSECYVGELKSMNKTYIQLMNVYDVGNKEYIVGNQLFYQSDIASIKTDTKKNNINSVSSNNDSDAENDSNISEITLDDIKEIDNRVQNAVYIFQTDHLYHDAIKDINSQESIALSVESCDRGRHTVSDIITIATNNKVYIFDIKFLGKIHPELRDPLEAKQPRKILYDGRNIADNLKFQHNLHISSIFDILVGHLSIGNEKRIIKLDECIQKYFKIHSSFLNFDKDINWHERPLDDNRKFITAKKAILIYKLHSIILHKYILKDFYKICNKFANIYRENSDSAEVASDMVSTNQNSLNSVDDLHLDLSISDDILNLEE